MRCAIIALCLLIAGCSLLQKEGVDVVCPPSPPKRIKNVKLYVADVSQKKFIRKGEWFSFSDAKIESGVWLSYTDLQDLLEP